MRHRDDERSVEPLPYMTSRDLIAAEEIDQVIRRRHNPNDRVTIERIE